MEYRYLEALNELRKKEVLALSELKNLVFRISGSVKGENN